MQRISIESYFNAASSGDLTTVQQYINENVKDQNAINVTDKSGNTALMLAANNNHIHIVLALLAIPEIKVDQRVMFLALFRNINAPQVNNVATLANTISVDAFIYAAKQDNLSVVEQYIRENLHNPKAINAVNNAGWTALCEAVAGRSINCVNALLMVPSIDIFFNKKVKRDSNTDEYSYLSAFNQGYNSESLDFKIKGSLIATAVKSLLKMKSDEATPAILAILSHLKLRLFYAIVEFPTKKEIFAALKTIVEEKEASAIGKVFCQGKKTFNKGVMAKVIAKYEELCKEFNHSSVIQKQEFSFGGFIGGVFGTKKKTTDASQANIVLDSDDDNKSESSNSL